MGFERNEDKRKRAQGSRTEGATQSSDWGSADPGASKDQGPSPALAAQVGLDWIDWSLQGAQCGHGHAPEPQQHAKWRKDTPQPV